MSQTNNDTTEEQYNKKVAEQHSEDIRELVKGIVSYVRSNTNNDEYVDLEINFEGRISEAEAVQLVCILSAYLLNRCDDYDFIVGPSFITTDIETFCQQRNLSVDKAERVTRNKKEIDDLVDEVFDELENMGDEYGA